MNVTLITCSFRGDLEVCRLLCRSIDLFASADFEHRLYVPERDLEAFADLAGPRRRLMTQESLLPRWFLKLPMPGQPWRRRLRLPRRNVYLTRHGLVRGWIAQQIMKLAASLEAETEVVAHLDSDAALIQPLRLEHLVRGDEVRLYAGPVVSWESGHALWYAAAARLLGLPAEDYYDTEYIAPLVVWRRSLIEAMTARIAATAGRTWQSALAATPHFSEYVLYGVFAERALGAEAAGLRRQPRSLCQTRWVGDFANAEEIERFIAETETDGLVCCLQSTLNIELQTRARIFGQAARVIAEQKVASGRAA